MVMLKVLSVFLLVLTVVACAAVDVVRTFPIRNIAKGAFSGIADAKQEVIKDRAGWEKLWSQHSVNKRGENRVPEIDFTKEIVIFVAMGRQRTGGYSIELANVEVVDQKLKISFKRKSPPPGAMATMALTAPFHIVAVPKSDLKAEFVEVKL